MPSRPLRRASFGGLLLLTSASLLASGCAHAEYDLVRPPDLAQHIARDKWTTVQVPPIEYRMTAYEDHLILRAYNPTDEPITLLADQSTVVDPGGQSHPLPARNQTILPRSYVKLILPPTRPRVVPTGPTIGIGFGGVFGSAYPYHRRFYRYGYGFGYGYDPFWYDYPRYYAVYGGGGDENLFWTWDNGGQVRLVLVYLRPAGPSGMTGAGGPATMPTTGPAGEGVMQAAPGPPQGSQGPPTFTHEFVFRQIKV